MKIMLKNVRLSFPSLFKTEQYAGEDTEKYAATFLIPKSDTKTVTAIEQACKQALIEKYGEGKVPKGFKMPLVDGDDKEYQGYADHVCIKANTKKRPTLVNRDKTPIAEEDGILYGGCYVNASIDVWVMDNRLQCFGFYTVTHFRFSLDLEKGALLRLVGVVVNV